MADDNITNFLNTQSGTLADSQTILSAVERLLARKEDIPENCDLAVCLVGIANRMTGSVGECLD